MIAHLDVDEQLDITKEKLVKLEREILIRLGFDFSISGPIPSIERFLIILGYD